MFTRGQKPSWIEGRSYHIGFEAIAGIAAAFVAPARPAQMPSTTTLWETMGDVLDNPSIQMDNKINPSRKCSVCIGVSGGLCVLVRAKVTLGPDTCSFVS